MKNVAMYTVGFWVLGLIVVAVDRGLPRRLLWPTTMVDDDVAVVPAAEVDPAVAG